MKPETIKVIFKRENNQIAMSLWIDGKIFTEGYTFQDNESAIGMMIDEFHHLTGNRYKEPEHQLKFYRI